ncbi:nucleotidyltransferase [Aquimarina algiphila]|uniref:nucleotidyltransferase n=1 Tax=Aquimarina algiphila TaxID=2047982 RepID=UPI00232FE197|nr:nucleotidyltransferase [Aquimarina algiphila]
MRTITVIKKEMTVRFMSNANLAEAYGYKIDSSFEEEFSLLSLENIFFDIVAFAIFILEKLFTQHSKEVKQSIYEQKIGSLRWYRNKALAFQYGFDLITDTDRFNNDGANEDQINGSKIIKYSAVTEAVDETRVIVKIAGESDEKLTPITPDQQSAFEFYIKELRFAGTPLTVINFEPDRLYLTIDIQIDRLVLLDNGVSIRDGNKPVEDALQQYMKELPFNGELILQSMVDKLQTVEGVVIVNVINVESSWIDGNTNDYGQPEPIDIKKIPESGYFEIVNFDSIKYVV